MYKKEKKRENNNGKSLGLRAVQIKKEIKKIEGHCNESHQIVIYRTESLNTIVYNWESEERNLEQSQNAVI